MSDKNLPPAMQAALAPFMPYAADRMERARTYVRNRLHAADNANHLGEAAVLRMAASEDLLEALEEAAEFIEGYADVVDGDYGVPAPNNAMQLHQALRAAIAKAGA